ncbi:MAG: family 43 glycosylhydrolase [Anaerolineae bacterium]|nr:family 43 glycosylhydrolase [Anaerolineae bacterium]
MTLRLDDKWVWDFWFARDGADYHIFYLQADRALKDETLRHWNVSVGHAVSQDLRQWEILPDALAPSPYDPASDALEPWDSKTTWTGSIIQHAGRWFFFYTGSRQSENGLKQRVGLALSDDLITWIKHPGGVLIDADPQWYELLDCDLWHDQAWRDPWVFQHPRTGMFHAFITGRMTHGPADGRGVIAHARSTNLFDWDVLPPVTEPGEFGQMEVPQVVEIGGRFYLLFSTNVSHFSAARQARGITPVHGTHYLVADDPLGPYRTITDEFMVGDAQSSLYSGKLIQGPDGMWQYMGFHDKAPDGEFIGEICDPLPVTVAEDGRLLVTRAE